MATMNRALQLTVLATIAAWAVGASLRHGSQHRIPVIGDDTSDLDDDGTYKYFDSSRHITSPFFVSPALRHKWRTTQVSRWDVGKPLPQDAPFGTVPQLPNGMPADFWPTPLNPPAYKTEDASGGTFIG